MRLARPKEIIGFAKGLPGSATFLLALRRATHISRQRSHGLPDNPLSIIVLPRTRAEQLPVKNHTITMGYATMSIGSTRLARLYLVLHSEGISRFDGRHQPRAGGLPRLVLDCLGRDVLSLFATQGGGLVEFNYR